MNDTTTPAGPELYPIDRMPAKGKSTPLDIPKVRATLGALRKGQGFTIPVEDLKSTEGLFRTTAIGQRIHKLAKGLGFKVSTKKIEGGLRVRREK